MSKRKVFRSLHESGCFVLPNPWDPGTTRYLQHLGFAALATTSAGYAWSRGKPDGDVSRREILTHIAEIVAATDLPVNADFESGFAETPEGVAESVRLCLETGVAGLSLEDRTRDDDEPLYPVEQAVDRLRAGRAAIDAVDRDVVLVARCEAFLVGRPDLDLVIRRLTAYSAAGADCLYAPGLSTREQIEAVVQAVAPKPVNVMVTAACGFTREEFEAMGVRRLSTGGALARLAWKAVADVSRELLDGRFTTLSQGYPGAELQRFFQ